MKPYVALMFCEAQDRREYARDVLAAVKAVAGDDFKYGESAANVVAIVFRSDKDLGFIVRAFKDLWRLEQRTWVLRLDDAVLIDQKLLVWAGKPSKG